MEFLCLLSAVCCRQQTQFLNVIRAKLPCCARNIFDCSSICIFLPHPPQVCHSLVWSEKNPCWVASFCLAVSRFFATFSINNLPTIVFHLQFFNLCSNVLFVKQGVLSAVHSSPNMFMIVAYISVLNTCLPRCVCVCLAGQGMSNEIYEIQRQLFPKCH